MKKFFGGMFIEEENLRKEGIYHPVKLEYYKIIENQDYKGKMPAYGLEIIRTEYFREDVKIEKGEMRNITNDENKIQNILTILKENRITPVGMQDTILQKF